MMVKERHYQGNPQKNSPALGATIAYLGIDGLLALLHGSQGCSTFCRLQLSRHFKEPIPLNSTALLEDSAIFGGWQHLKDGIARTADKYKPKVIGVMSSGLTETYGDDMVSALASLRSERPDLGDVPVVLTFTPDYIGSMQEGYLRAVISLVDTLTERNGAFPDRKDTIDPGWRGVAVFPGSHLTPGEIDEIKEIIASFDLIPVTIPDISDSLDGHAQLIPSPTVSGGAKLSDFTRLPHCMAAFSFGVSMNKVGKLLNDRYQVPHFNIPALTGVNANDHFIRVLAQVSGRPIPDKIKRQRNRLLDMLADYHDQLAEKRIALALESDLLHSLATCLEEVGSDVEVALAATSGKDHHYGSGDLEELEIRAVNSQLIIANSNGRQCAKLLNTPHLRAGLPVFDKAGESMKNWIGYRGTQQFLSDVINTMSLE